MQRSRTSIGSLLALVTAVATLALVAPGPAGSEPGRASTLVDEILERPRLVRVTLRTPADRARLESLGLDLSEHSTRRHADVVVRTRAERRALAASGLPTRVLVADLVRHEIDRAAADRAYAARVARSPLPSGRTSYRMFADYQTEMGRLAKRHPRLVKLIELHNPGLDGRPVLGLEIGTDVRRRVSGKPTFVMLGAHHAREWPSAEHSMEFAYQVIRGFGSDPEVTRLLKRSRVVVVPIVNVDGFDLSRTSGEYVELNALNPIDPTGELGPTATTFLTPGLSYLRKNCRIADGVDPVDGSCLLQLTSVGGINAGVDLNRNYGTWWGGPGAASGELGQGDLGPLHPTYRGAAPFSEPETRNVRRLVLGRNVTMLITNHTFGNLVLRPWASAPTNVTDTGTTVGPAPDEAALKKLGDAMARRNGYTSQLSAQLYDGVGTTEDWVYGATGSFGYTFEIGPSEFHPPFEDVVDLYDDGNREAYLVAWRAAVDRRLHSVIRGRAPRGAFLTIRRDATVPTWSGTARSRLATSIRVPRSGAFTWDVNPSTRPLVASSGRRESYVLTCQRTRSGPVRQQVRATVDRGQAVRVALRRC